ncbi:hypothetical protein ACO0LD_08550 [Undibacterium sp. Ji83W]|uniref:hypothetical protein n=1 Tax=Undibacterium sp. Ji83W TaxID=3413043 RepID=UPI003BF3AE97
MGKLLSGIKPAGKLPRLFDLIKSAHAAFDQWISGINSRIDARPMSRQHRLGSWERIHQQTSTQIQMNKDDN